MKKSIQPIYTDDMNRMFRLAYMDSTDTPSYNENPKRKPLFVKDEQEQFVSVWRLTFWQRLYLLIFGKLILCVRSDDRHPPVWLGIYKEKK